MTSDFSIYDKNKTSDTNFIFNKTKIICTIGPSSDKISVIKEMILNGMNVARFNFSHASEKDEQRINKIRQVSLETGIPVAILIDTKGPEIRLGYFEKGKIELQKDQDFLLTTESIIGDQSQASITYPGLPHDVKAGDAILIDDGRISLIVLKTSENKIFCKVKSGGKVSDRKGINVPNIKLNMNYISEADKNDILFSIKHDFDFIAASFVRNSSDIIKLRKFLDENGGDQIEIISKIENKEGVDNIDEILKISDGIMVARGDMGVEIDFVELPQIQKMIIKKCNSLGKIVITATQMLESMTENPRPTRAEISDVANAVYDGTSAVMLSGETASGKYPVECVRTMSKIVKEAEKDIEYAENFNKTPVKILPDITFATSHSACVAAHNLNAKAIIAITKSGKTAKMVSSLRPLTLIIASVMGEKLRRQLCLYWGVYSVVVPFKDESEEIYMRALEISISLEYVKEGDVIVATSSEIAGFSGMTNTMKIHKVTTF